MSLDENDDSLEAYRDWQIATNMRAAEDAARMYAATRAESETLYWALYKAYLQGWMDSQS